MSIIERAVRRIGLTKNDSVDHEESRTNSERQHDQSSIERAISQIEKSSNFSDSSELGRTKSSLTDDSREEFGRSSARILASPPELPEAQKESTKSDAGKTSLEERIKIDRHRLLRLGMVQPDGTRDPVAECIRLIKSQLMQNISRSRSDPPANLIMVTSSVGGEGKTYVATNLAISMATERDHRVLLVDADVAKPSIPSVLGLKAEYGLMDILDRGTDPAEVIRKTDIGKLSVLAAGTAHQQATELLSSDAMHALAQHLARYFDDRVVIFDSPPLLAASEAGALATHMGQIVVVVEAGKTSEVALMDALQRIDSGKVVGTVLNKVWSRHRHYGHGY